MKHWIQDTITAICLIIMGYAVIGFMWAMVETADGYPL
jgi:hypothetical protein